MATGTSRATIGARHKQALCGGEDVAEALVAGDGEAQGFGEGFEDGFDLVVRGVAVHELEVDVGGGGLREAAEKVFEEFGLEVAYFGRGEFPGADAVGAAGEVEGGGGEAIVHGHQEIAGAEDAALCAQGLLDGFAQGYAYVFYGVVLVYVEVAFGFEFEIEAAVAGDLFEHVVEEADARGDLGAALAVEVQAEGDVGFLGGALELGFSHVVALGRMGGTKRRNGKRQKQILHCVQDDNEKIRKKIRQKIRQKRDGGGCGTILHAEEGFIARRASDGETYFASLRMTAYI